MVKSSSLSKKSKPFRRAGGGSLSNTMALGGGFGFSKRRFLPRPRPTTSVVVTVSFVTIFTIIITMEVILMDEARRKASTVISDDAGGVRDVNNWVDRETQEINLLQKQLAVHLDLTDKVWTSDNGERSNVVINDIFGLNPAVNAVHVPLPTSSVDNQKINSINVNSGGNWFYSNQSVTADDWQPVLEGKEKFYVYSAYLDSRRGGTIRVIGATRTRTSEKVQCIFWYHNNVKTPSVVVHGTIKVIRENWNLKYSAVFVLCPLETHGGGGHPSAAFRRPSTGTRMEVPDEVSIIVVPPYFQQAKGSNKVYDRQSEIGNRLPVLNRNSSSNNVSVENGFAVCVKPLHYNFNRAVQLIEFIELNRILGVSHFTFYNHTIGHETSCVLRHYIQEGVVTLLPWQLDMISQKEIRTEGLFAAINDCVYRYMHRYRYLVMIDIDEFIVPHRNLTLTAMVREFHKKIDPQKAGSFSFMNSFFYLQWPNDSNSRELPVPLVTLQKTKRRAKLHPHKQRSKCIIAPGFVVEMGNHFVWEFIPGKGSINVPPEIAFLHHYRVCEFGGNDCVKTPAVTDRTLYRYKNSLVQRVIERFNSTSQYYLQTSYLDSGQYQYPADCKGLNTTNMTYIIS